MQTPPALDRTLAGQGMLCIYFINAAVGYLYLSRVLTPLFGFSDSLSNSGFPTLWLFFKLEGFCHPLRFRSAFVFVKVPTS